MPSPLCFGSVEKVNQSLGRCGGNVPTVDPYFLVEQPVLPPYFPGKQSGDMSAFFTQPNLYLRFFGRKPVEAIQVKLDTNRLFAVWHSFKLGHFTNPLVSCLAFPFAYVVATRVKANYKNLVLLTVLVPLYTSDIVRIFAWRSVLGVNGFINQTLMGLGVITEPIEALLFSPTGALVSLTHMMFPFMFLAVWAGLENMKSSLIESAMDLGAGPLRVIRKVVFPLALPGVLAGFLFVFIPVTGDYVYVNLMGGPGGVTVTKAIVQQFGAANHWPFASTLAVAMLLSMVFTILMLGILISRLPSIRMYFMVRH